MAEPFYTMLRVLHVGGGWLAFGIAPIALLALKGSRRHVLAGRGFVLSMATGITAGLILAAIDQAVGLLLFGIVTLFFLATGYLAPRIGRGSRASYRWDRALTAVGALGSLGMIGDGLRESTQSVVFGGLGLAIAVAHARWRGPRDRTRWPVEHLTSLLAAYTVSWSFILGQYVQVLPERGRLVVPVLGGLAILWARRRVTSARGWIAIPTG
jgi:hypothetical protein